MRPVLGLLLCVAAWGQRPSDADAAAMIERARARTRAYAESLPDFLATEVIRRYVGGAALHGYPLSPTDTIAVQLRYYRHHEDHKLLLFNGAQTQQTFEGLEGFVGSGEFGATLTSVFDPATETTFRWQSWKTAGNVRVAVFTYTVDASRSGYLLASDLGGHEATALVGYRGTVEFDQETGDVLHFEYMADSVPQMLCIAYVATSVDYSLAEIGGRTYLLPSRSRSEMRGPVQWIKNLAEFGDYRKFSADSTVDFAVGK